MNITIGHHVELYWQGIPGTFGWQCLDCAEEEDGLPSAAAAREASAKHSPVIVDPVTAEWPEHWTVDDVLRDQHARYHDQCGNLLGREDCGWERCAFWDVAQHLASVGLIRRPIPSKE